MKNIWNNASKTAASQRLVIDSVLYSTASCIQECFVFNSVLHSRAYCIQDILGIQSVLKSRASCIQKRLVFKRVFESRASWIQERFVFESVCYSRASSIREQLFYFLFFFQVVNKGLTSYRDPGSAPGRGQKTLHITAADMDLTKVLIFLTAILSGLRNWKK